jgi:TonB family protein
MRSQLPVNRTAPEGRDTLRVVVARESLTGLRRHTWQDTDHHPAVSRLALGISAALHLCIITACAFWPETAALMIEDVYAVTLPPASELIPPMRLAWISATSETAAESFPTNSSFSADQQGLESPFWSGVRTAVARRIEYPPDARRQGIEGTAVLRLTVTADGRLTEVVSLEFSAEVFAEAALHAVRRAAPFPATTNGATTLSAVLPVRFRLNEGDDKETR